MAYCQLMSWLWQVSCGSTLLTADACTQKEPFKVLTPQLCWSVQDSMYRWCHHHHPIEEPCTCRCSLICSTLFTSPWNGNNNCIGKRLIRWVSRKASIENLMFSRFITRLNTETIRVFQPKNKWVFPNRHFHQMAEDILRVIIAGKWLKRSWGARVLPNLFPACKLWSSTPLQECLLFSYSIPNMLI